LAALDNTTPRLDGFGVVRALRGDPATSAAPIVMLTGRASEDDRAVSVGIGVDEYIPKPFSPREVSARSGARWSGLDTKVADLGPTAAPGCSGRAETSRAG